MTNAIPVYLTNSAKVRNFAAILILVALPSGLFLYGWSFQDAATALLLAGFGTSVVGVTIFLVLKAKLLRFSSAPVFIVRTDALEIPPGKILPWRVFKDAVVFTYEGNKSIGLRLREDLEPPIRSDIESRFAHDLDWQMFRMPLTMAFSGLSMSGQELISELQRHGLKIAIMETEIGLGQESALM